MKFEEILLKTTVTTDEKARRRTNVSGLVANITLESIENGVSIETLMNLNVPVFRYGGQVTIHGVLPDVADVRVNGYKSIIKNGNGTIGVKYQAIDGVKKDLIKRSHRQSDDNIMSVGSDSTGMFIQKRFFVKDEAIEFLNLIPDLFIGTKYIGAYMGVYYVVIDFMSIEEKNLWKFIEWLTGLETIDELVALEKIQKDKYDAECDERAVERELAKAKLKVKTDLITSICDKHLPKAPDGFQKTVGTFCKVTSLGKLNVYTLFKENGRMKYCTGFTINALKTFSTMKRVFKSVTSKGQWYLIDEDTSNLISEAYKSEINALQL
jgi:hypothetical protein